MNQDNLIFGLKKFTIFTVKKSIHESSNEYLPFGELQIQVKIGGVLAVYDICILAQYGFIGHFVSTRITDYQKF